MLNTEQSCCFFGLRKTHANKHQLTTQAVYMDLVYHTLITQPHISHKTAHFCRVLDETMHFKRTAAVSSSSFTNISSKTLASTLHSEK